jgi:conjugal transfer pilus assembly protein TraW
MAQRRFQLFRVLLALALSVGGAPATAKDLGAYGATFEVIEQDLLSVLLSKLKAAEASGKMAELNRAFVARVKARLNRPVPVAGVSATVQPRTWLFDPSITVPQDFADASGRVFAHKGDVIDPLDRLPGFNRVLVFIDGDDPRQVAFALQRARRDPKAKAYIVLTSGAPLDLMRRSGVEMFFDQDGSLSGHFGVTHVPAVVEREGRALRVSELRP